MTTDDTGVFVPDEEQKRMIDKMEKKHMAAIHRMRGEKPTKRSNNSADPMDGDDEEDSPKYRKLFDAVDKLTVYRGAVPSDISTWEFSISGSVLRIPADKMTTDRTFKVAYLNTFFRPLSLPEEGWTRFIRTLGESDKFEIRDAEESDKVYVANQVFEIIAQMRIDKDKEDPFNGSALFDDGGEYLYILNTKITEILISMQFRIGMKQLSETMLDLGLKTPGTKPIKHEGKLKRFWAVRKDSLGKFGRV